MCGEVCTDNRFELIEKAKEYILENTNISSRKDEMKVLDSFLFRCWQMGWLDRFDNPKSPWISVKDDLPCNHEELLRNDILTKKVLVVSKDKEDNNIRVCTNYMLKVGIFSQPTNEYRWSGEFYNEVTHWMPLPEPPKE